jgi:hypothetical protein
MCKIDHLINMSASDMPVATPPIRRFRTGDRVYVRAQQVWLILVAHVMSTRDEDDEDRFLTYGELAERMGEDRRASIGLGRELGIVGLYCIENRLPALNCIVVSAADRKPGYGVLTRENKNWKQEAREALRTDWFGFRAPSTGTLRKVWQKLRKGGLDDE